MRYCVKTTVPVKVLYIGTDGVVCTMPVNTSVTEWLARTK